MNTSIGWIYCKMHILNIFHSTSADILATSIIVISILFAQLLAALYHLCSLQLLANTLNSSPKSFHLFQTTTIHISETVTCICFDCFVNSESQNFIFSKIIIKSLFPFCINCSRVLCLDSRSSFFQFFDEFFISSLYWILPSFCS